MRPYRSHRRSVAFIDGGAVVEGGVGLGCAGFVIAMIAAWLTHVVWVIGKLAGPAGITGGQFLLAILGSFVPPVGVVHGVMIWFGAGF